MSDQKVSMIGTLTLWFWSGDIYQKLSAIGLAADMHDISIRYSTEIGFFKNKLHLVATGTSENMDRFEDSVEFVLGKRVIKT